MDVMGDRGRWLCEVASHSHRSRGDGVPGKVLGLITGYVPGNEIASCQETAYESLSVKAAVTLLFFTSQSELLVFAQERGWEVNLILGTIMFGPKGKKTMDIPKERIISTSLLYARQLEQIV
ncbi:hypothetical protein B0H14DRAFT_2572609 [Mycena olivaceomarginata]|nr:hypothetical protein B0H14DRAFT_2572609 [Mycena olivaceomarginata]